MIYNSCHSKEIQEALDNFYKHVKEQNLKGDLYVLEAKFVDPILDLMENSFIKKTKQ